MGFFRTEYIIQKYCEEHEEWESRGCSYTSLDTAVARLDELRKVFDDHEFRVVELTSSIKIIDV